MPADSEFAALARLVPRVRRAGDGAALASPASCIFLVHDTLRTDAVAGVMMGRV